MDLKELQKQHSEWLYRELPEKTWQDCFVKLVEEVGELANALYRSDNAEKEQDAIGDVLISLVSVANRRNRDVNKCVEDAWKEVNARKLRDEWKRHTEHGEYWERRVFNHTMRVYDNGEVWSNGGIVYRLPAGGNFKQHQAFAEGWATCRYSS